VNDESRQVPVPGGELVAHRLADAGAGAPVVLAVHGITANGLSMTRVAAALAGRVTVWAPDLRGRADSRAVGPPYSLGRHAEDLVAVLDAVRAERAVVVGHSMGAFVAAVLAARHPQRVSRLVLVDGGFAFPLAADASTTDIDGMLEAVLGPAMRRLSMTFGSYEEYLRFWTQHPALGPALSGPAGDDLRRYLRHDLRPTGDGGWRSSCVLEAVRADGAGVLADAEAHAGAASAVAAGVDVRFLWAPRGLLDEPQGLYDEQRIGALGLPPQVHVERVPDVNHYTVILDDVGRRAIAAAVVA
jgi:pimeloyl-ACP methyl ester carboxylesterase